MRKRPALAIALTLMAAAFVLVVVGPAVSRAATPVSPLERWPPRGDLGLAAVLEHRQKSKIRGRGRP